MAKAKRLEMDAAALKALAHPLRVRIHQILALRGQVSVTSLAKELDESTGATSYHLRQLAKHGLVEQCEPPDGGGRQRWWRMAVDEIHLSGFEFMANNDTREAVGFVLREYNADRTRKLSNWYTTATEWPQEWQKASSDMDGRLRLNAKQTRALADEVSALIAKYDQLKPGRGARAVDVQYAIFPTDTGDRP
ncbi:MAG: helix-turn-helix domain-containing protein [Jatrophihabitantaceae bacterium]